VFFFYVYELRLSATMLLNEYDDDDDDELHMERRKGSFPSKFQCKVIQRKEGSIWNLKY